MPTPRHLRHPAPHPPHRHTTSIPTPTPQHTPPDRHAPPARHTRPLHTHLTTPYRFPSTLYLYICTSHHLLPHILTQPSAALSTLPYSSPPLFRTHSPHPQHLAAIFLYSFPPLFRAPSAPPSAEKFALPRLKQAVTHLWKSFVPKEEEDLSSRPYSANIMWITL